MTKIESISQITAYNKSARQSDHLIWQVNVFKISIDRELNQKSSSKKSNKPILTSL